MADLQPVRSDSWNAFIHLVIVTLNMLSIAPVVLFFFMGGVHNHALGFLIGISVFSWLILLVLTLILVISSHEHRRIALYGMLATFGLCLLSGFAFPAIT